MGVYLWVDEPIVPITTSWIYHNSSLWLISLSSDWSTRYTIADKNLGATTVYNNWDTLSWSNCGSYFQRGNVRAFPNMWTASFSYSSTAVDASTYWPWNYYNWWWINVNPRDSTINYDLYWWVTDTVEAKKWPCDTWYHIPSITEWTDLFNLWVSMWVWSASSYSNLISYLKLPLAWIRNWSDTTMLYVNQAAAYWSATRSNANNGKMLLILWSVDLWSHFNVYYGFPIRAFKNEATQPREWWDWTKLN